MDCAASFKLMVAVVKPFWGEVKDVNAGDNWLKCGSIGECPRITCSSRLCIRINQFSYTVTFLRKFGVGAIFSTPGALLWFYFCILKALIGPACQLAIASRKCYIDSSILIFLCHDCLACSAADEVSNSSLLLQPLQALHFSHIQLLVFNAM